MGKMPYCFQILVKAWFFLNRQLLPEPINCRQGQEPTNRMEGLYVYPKLVFLNINYISQFRQISRFYQLQQIDIYNMGGGRTVEEERLPRYPKIECFGRM